MDVPVKLTESEEMKDQQLCEHCGYNQFIISEEPKKKSCIDIRIICVRCRKTYRDFELKSYLDRVGDECVVRTFASGATRHTDDKKHDYEGFLSPWAIRRYGEYMHAHRVQADGELRDSDNWQKGIPRDQYMKSLLRHSIDVWSIFRGLFTFDKKDDSKVGIEDALCGVIFNASGLLHEILRKRDYK